MNYNNKRKKGLADNEKCQTFTMKVNQASWNGLHFDLEYNLSRLIERKQD